MQIFRVVVQVGDIEHAARFYAAVLDGPGFRVSPGRHYFPCGGVILACVAPAMEEGGAAVPSADCFYMSTGDLEAAYRACKAAGADFEAIDVHGTPGGQIAVRPWGERSFYVQDPWGNSLCFVDETTLFTGT